MFNEVFGIIMSCMKDNRFVLIGCVALICATIIILNPFVAKSFDVANLALRIDDIAVQLSSLKINFNEQLLDQRIDSYRSKIYELERYMRDNSGNTREVDIQRLNELKADLSDTLEKRAILLGVKNYGNKQR